MVSSPSPPEMLLRPEPVTLRMSLPMPPSMEPDLVLRVMVSSPSPPETPARTVMSLPTVTVSFPAPASTYTPLTSATASESITVPSTVAWTLVPSELRPLEIFSPASVPVTLSWPQEFVEVGAVAAEKPASLQEDSIKRCRSVMAWLGKTAFRVPRPNVWASGTEGLVPPGGGFLPEFWNFLQGWDFDAPAGVLGWV